MSELGIFYPTIPEGGGEIPVVRERYDSEIGYHLVFEGEDCFEAEPPRPFYVIPRLDDSETSTRILVIPSIRTAVSPLHPKSYRFTLVDTGAIYGGYAIEKSEKTYTYLNADGAQHRSSIFTIPPIYQLKLPFLEDFDIWTHAGSSISAMSPQNWWDGANIEYDSANVSDLSDAATTLNQIIAVLKQLSAATPETMITKYMTLDASYQMIMARLIGYWNTSLTENKTPIYYALNNGTCAITDVTYTAPINESFATGIYKEIDFTDNKIYDMKITFNQQKLFFQCTCHEAASLS